MDQNKKKDISRRGFFKLGLGTLGTVAASSSIADVCKVTTGAQPLGPFFPQEGTPTLPVIEDPTPGLPIALANDNDLTFVQGQPGTAEGQIVVIRGRVLGPDCKPVENANVIAWQASSTGRYNHMGDGNNEDFVHPKTGQTIKRILDPNFQYWGKAVSNAKGEYSFKTIVPGFYPADLAGGWYRPPHIHMMVSATGREQFVTQMYFKGEKIKDNDWHQELNAKDFLLENPNLTEAQRNALVVEFSESEEPGLDGILVGQFDLNMP